MKCFRGEGSSRENTMARTEPNPLTPHVIRRARPSEADALSELAYRSKGYWGYDAAFMAAARADFTTSADEIATSLVYLCEGRDGLAGYYRLVVLDDGAAELDDLFVDPAAIGSGVGRALWLHAVAEATARGCSRLVFQSDPHAEEFYLTMGARRIGESPSTVIPGRSLPLMSYALGETPQGE
jgi:GNAT superfamily N-acetyltransferase